MTLPEIPDEAEGGGHRARILVEWLLPERPAADRTSWTDLYPRLVWYLDETV